MSDPADSDGTHDESDAESTEPSVSTPDLDDPQFYLNRELSQLEFQKRVLHEALDDRTPLLERVRFLGIFTRNLDEFFMKRVGGLKQQIDAGVTDPTVDGRTPREQWTEILETAGPMFDRQTACYHDVVRPALAEAGIHILDHDDLTATERDRMRAYFEESVLPTLTPLAFDPAHPFPFISNLSLSLGVFVRHDPDEDPIFTRVKVPQNRPRLVPVEEGSRYVLLEDLIEAHLDLLMPNVEVLDTALFRITRNAEVRRDQEVAEDLIEAIEEVIEQRRFAMPVRLEIGADAPEAMVELLADQLELDPEEVFRRRGPLDYRDFGTLTDLDRSDLKRERWSPLPHPRFAEGSTAEATMHGADLFDEIARDDVLLHHPYHAFDGTVQRFLDAAASDPDVLAIKAAIYRTASDSQVIQRLIDAADNGKQVAVMVELKARFDEQNNLQWVRKLEENGIHVAYGTVGLKTHTKTALVVREEDDGVKLYSHVATGNYHSETAKGYVDLGLLTADRDVGQDLVTVFNFFTGPSLDEEFRKLLVAPVTMRERFTDLIRKEARYARAGRPARIVAKMNALEDPDIVAELYRASMAGVEIDLVVRDICRLRPGIEGVSDTVTVRSVVGRFLEHSRIYYFENGAGPDDPEQRTPGADEGGDPQYFVGSADWMTRNLDYRVEAVAPVTDPDLREQLRFVLEVMLHDNRSSWALSSDGSYEQRTPGDDPVWRTQEILMDATRAAHDHDDSNGIDTDHPASPGELLVAADEDYSSD